MLSPSVFITGLAFGFSLIVAIGAQNVFVLRQGAMRSHVGVVVAICTVSDALLIAAGVAGAGAVLDRHAAALDAVRVAGGLALLTYARLAARRALRASVTSASDGALAPATARAAVIGACLAFTWLNPAVYLDTVVLLGSVAATTHGGRWSFGAGAAAASLIWFCALGFGARLLTGALSHPRAWRALDAFVAVVMTITAVRVLLGS